MQKISSLLFLFLCISVTSISQINLNNGLVAYYPFSGNANDASGNNHHGILSNGPQLTTDRLGNPNSAYYFDGIDDFIQILNSPGLNPTNGLSVALLFNPEQSGIQTLIGKIGYNPGLGTQFQVAMDFGPQPGVLFGVNPFSNDCLGVPLNAGYVNTGGSINVNQWYCVVGTFENGVLKIYLNGVLMETVNTGFNFLNQCTNADIQIGSWWAGDLQRFKGKIDEVRIYNRALNQQEVSALCETSTSCNNWLRTTTTGDHVTTGDVDVTGNKLTVEVNFNRTAPANSTGGYGFLVSKHTTVGDINYALWPNGCAISTTNGDVWAMENCNLQLNKTYHVAMVYDGVTLKFYRNGFLMSQSPASGNLVNQDLLTTIAQTPGVGYPEIYQFFGVTNEVRIWNVTRTQTEIQTYMNTSLPSPATQTGLLAYYTFDDLLNKQGNTAFNGSLGGNAVINQVNPNCSFVPDSCAIVSPTCNNWLSLPSSPSSVTAGELDIQGNKITVEAMINRTTPYTGGNLYAGDIVSKHDGPPDVNYLLRPNSAEITTTNGYFITPEICPIELNKTYHVAMVYDGSTLKFYRNGFLMSQVAATGNLIQNDWPLRIGYYFNQSVNTNFIGYVNEVRIWNTVRSQTDIRNYMNSSLPSPTTQTGLQAYYTFDNLQNKQGNTAYNGSLSGSALINQFNPNCLFVPDTCEIDSPISDIINSYTEVISLDICKNTMIVSDATEFNVGDTVIIAQMKGAHIDVTNSSAFGTLVNYRNAGNYEFNYISQKNGNQLVLRNVLLRAYDVPDGVVQLVRVPYYIDATITRNLTAAPWNGKTGGILAFNVRDTLNLQANIDVSGKGFSGGIASNHNINVSNCTQNEYVYPLGSNLAAPKGESIALIGNNISNGKGAPANAGGGGLDHNSGGGGGGNGGIGGFGGYQLEACTGSNFDNRGIGGRNLNYSNANNTIFLGGGGGAGHCNQVGGINLNGGNGGGIIIIQAQVIRSNGFKILATGANAVQCNLPNIDNCHDGSGGGGAGGTILLNTNFISNATVDVKGGKGGDLIIFNNFGGGRIGPGAGGGGGVVWLNTPTLPASVTVNKQGGANGVILMDNNNPWGATPGQPGINLFNLNIPLSTILFEKNIDSLLLVDSLITCKNVRFQSTAITRRDNIASWHWNFGDGVDMVSQTGNLTHEYASAGTYPVKLVVTDTKGCQDSIMISVIIEDVTANISPVAPLCLNQSVTLNGSGGNIYSWTPAQYLNDSTLQNPIANVNVTTRFYLTVRNTSRCYDTASILVSVVPKPVFNAPTAPNAACEKIPLQLNGNNSSQYTYLWSPSTFLNDPTSANPITIPDNSITYAVRISESVCNYDSNFNLSVIVNPNPIVTAQKANDIDCSNLTSQLQASGALNYVWSPAIGLDNPIRRNPIAAISSNTTYIVTGTNEFGCTDSDTISIKVTTDGKPIFELPNAFTPNGDGKNDCFGIRRWGNVSVKEFSIFNRWGQLVFSTKDPTRCWDGTINGQKQATGGYTYVILANSICGEIKKTGIVMLIR